LIAILDHYSVQLGNLVGIFQALSSAAPTTEQGKDSLGQLVFKLQTFFLQILPVITKSFDSINQPFFNFQGLKELDSQHTVCFLLNQVCCYK
jgi:hypothetical protein